MSVFVDLLKVCKRGQLLPFDQLCQRTFVGNGVALMDRKEMFCAKAHGVAVRMDQCVVRSPPLNGFQESHLFLQNFPSIVASHALEVRVSANG